jgi:hypothetical protein
VTAWASVDDAHAAWRESSTIPAARLEDLLEVATDVLTPYARPQDLDPTGVPVTAAANRLREACVAHARDMWAVSVSDTGDVIGFDSYGVRRRPLSDHVRALMRPAHVPLVG